MTAPMLSAPQPLAERHQLADFDSGQRTLDDWLRRRAAKTQANLEKDGREIGPLPAQNARCKNARFINSETGRAWGYTRSEAECRPDQRFSPLT